MHLYALNVYANFKKFQSMDALPTIMPIDFFSPHFLYVTETFVTLLLGFCLPLVTLHKNGFVYDSMMSICYIF